MGSQARNGHQQEEILFVIFSSVERDLVEFLPQEMKVFLVEWLYTGSHKGFLGFVSPFDLMEICSVFLLSDCTLSNESLAGRQFFHSFQKVFFCSFYIFLCKLLFPAAGYILFIPIHSFLTIIFIIFLNLEKLLIFHSAIAIAEGEHISFLLHICKLRLTRLLQQ